MKRARRVVVLWEERSVSASVWWFRLGRACEIGFRRGWWENASAMCFGIWIFCLMMEKGGRGLEYVQIGIIVGVVGFVVYGTVRDGEEGKPRSKRTDLCRSRQSLRSQRAVN